MQVHLRGTERTVTDQIGDLIGGTAAGIGGIAPERGDAADRGQRPGPGPPGAAAVIKTLTTAGALRP